MGQREAIAEVLRRLICRQLVAVIEARHWHEGRRDGDTKSLLHFWLYFDNVPPVTAHGCGEHLSLEFAKPYASYDMEDQGETRVGPTQPPDLLAAYVGQVLLNAALVQGYTSEPSVGGVRLRFERADLVVASLGDEWLLIRGPIPEKLTAYLTVGDWLASRTDE